MSIQEGPVNPEQGPAVRPESVDLREQLANDCACGEIEKVSVPKELITSLHGVLLDFDPKWFRADRLPAGALDSPEQLHRLFVSRLLARHPVYARAEVRVSGTGLHGILWVSPPAVMSSSADQDRWAAAVRIIQTVLPTDPDCPGITALTRPIGSINGKNGEVVCVLKAGTPVTSDDVLELVAEIREAPFRVAAEMLVGTEVSPCPVCRRDGTKLGIMDHTGRCYGGCGRVTHDKLLDAFMLPRSCGQED
jgi:hypothetical protein